MKTQNFTVHCLSCVRRLTMAIDCASWFGSKWMVYVIERQRAGGKFSTVCFVNYCCTQTQIQNINDVRYIYSCWRTRRHWRILANHRFAFVICTTAQIALLRPLMRQCWCFFNSFFRCLPGLLSGVTLCSSFITFHGYWERKAADGSLGPIWIQSQLWFWLAYLMIDNTVLILIIW